MGLVEMSESGSAGGGGRMRLADVAAAAGVSTFTVSASLRGDARVAAGTRERIVALAREMGYERDAAAALLAGRRVRGRGAAARPRIGLVNFTELTLWDPGEGGGYAFVKLKFPARGEALAAVLRQWWNQGIAGLVVDTRWGAGDRVYLDGALERGIGFEQFPVVTIGPSRFSCVRDSAVGAMAEALERVKAAGYRRIAVLLKATDQRADDRARLGAVLLFREELPEGVTVAHRMLSWGPAESEQLSLTDCAWLSAWAPDVVVSFPGGLYYGLLESGFVIPRDFAFCGVPVPLEMGRQDQIAGMETRGREFCAAALELMDQQLRLGLRGLPTHPLVRVITLNWSDGASLPGSTTKN